MALTEKQKRAIFVSAFLRAKEGKPPLFKSKSGKPFAVKTGTDKLHLGKKGVITLGESVARVYEVAGEPRRVVQLENKFGAGRGERLEYLIGETLVQIVVRGGHVVSIA